MSHHNDDFMLGNICISPQHNTLSRGEVSCRLQPKVMALLLYLHGNRERVIGNEELLEQVWQGRIVTLNSIQKSMNALRAAFSEFDKDKEYVYYFSKRGYQLVLPYSQETKHPSPSSFVGRNWTKLLSLLVFVIVVTGLLFMIKPWQGLFRAGLYTASEMQYTQVEPYVSNTGYENIIEPYSNGKQVAIVRDEPQLNGETKSLLLLMGVNGQEWQLSQARGQFVDVAWSASGRNLVVLEVHPVDSITQNDAPKPNDYYTFHIFTLDFKGEKLIEKNVLSHWLGKVNSVSWWDENTIEFVATNKVNFVGSRYHYNIAQQTLNQLEWPRSAGELLVTQLFNKQVAELRRLDGAEYIQVFDERQNVIMQQRFVFHIVSMSWTDDGAGLLILADDGRLFIVDKNDHLRSVYYAPKVTGSILRARTMNQATELILTLRSSGEVLQGLPLESAQSNAQLTPKARHFWAAGGGFKYSAAPAAN